MELKKLIELNKAIDEIEQNPELNEFEKYFELLVLKNELDELKAKKNTPNKSGYNLLFGLN
ncbi:hypothetical protein [Tenacibaculum ovolyticum]|uniref:hypothetical protein n=1 Tax=Tenacibaculum ovolyticum TaxID=104270 RepID=UPI0007EDAD3F|nr:hypothetical protein [Tenacibaculum ovolyticum]